MALALTAPSLRTASSRLSLLPKALSPGLFSSLLSTSISIRRMPLPFLPSAAAAIPAAININIPSWLEWIWEGILKAVPKKKTTHSRKRHRQMAGKALKDVTSLCRCPACGEIKRMHYLCPHCVSRMKNLMHDKAKETQARLEDFLAAKPYRRENKKLQKDEPMTRSTTKQTKTIPPTA